MLTGKGKIRPSALLNKNNEKKKHWESGAHQQLCVTSKMNAVERSEAALLKMKEQLILIW
jgi:hypothetical protein